MSFLTDAWYKESRWIRVLKPLSAVFGLVSAMRKHWYQNSKRIYTSRYPVIIVGNLTAGGTGKTPLVIFLAQQLREQGFKPGIVSRGYGSKAPSYPFAVTPATDFREAGEESLMIARHTQCPVIIDPDRVSAVQYLEAHFHCDIIISDDGMQHYRLDRTLEIVVIDGQRGFGNGLLLPAGPLRESPERLQSVDMIVCNGGAPIALSESAYRMDLDATHLVHLADNKYLSVKDEILQNMTAKKVHAVSGIGNPERFFNSLCACGFDIITHIFRDHHLFASGDIQFDDDLDVVMTEKDAVKCNEFASDRHWYLKVVARLPENFIQQIIDLLPAISNK